MLTSRRSGILPPSPFDKREHWGLKSQSLARAEPVLETEIGAYHYQKNGRGGTWEHLGSIPPPSTLATYPLGGDLHAGDSS